MIAFPVPSLIKNISQKGGRVYLVGGNVRDYFLGLPFKDHDLVVQNIPYNDLIQILKPIGWTNVVGKTFGVVKFRPRENPDLELDLSLPRVEKSTGTGHKDFEVDFNPNLPIEQDLARRDFTINAMAIELGTEKLIDPFSGKKDLDQKILRQVFKEAFTEDALRILRGVQFSARFHLKIEPETFKAMKENVPLVATVSKERIAQEIQKLFLAPKPSLGFDLMREIGLLEILFPFIPPMIGVIQPMKRGEDVYEHTMKVLDASRKAHELENPGNINIMLAALLHDAGKPKTYRFNPEKNRVTFYNHQSVSRKIAKPWLEEYKVTTIGANPKKILGLVQNHMFETKSFYSDKAIRRFVNKVGQENIFDLIDLRVADKKGGKFPDAMHGIMKLRERIKEELNKKPPFGPGDLALNGHDIMNLGFKPGPIIGQIQKFLIEKALDNPELNTKETLTQLIQENFKV